MSRNPNSSAAQKTKKRPRLGVLVIVGGLLAGSALWVRDWARSPMVTETAPAAPPGPGGTQKRRLSVPNQFFARTEDSEFRRVWPPQSLVYEKDDGAAALYTSAVNEATCHLAVSATETWLGTAWGGVKRIQTNPGGGDPARRLYNIPDGLPAGRVLALAAATPDEIWCAVALDTPGSVDGMERGVALCRWQRASDRWEVSREISLPVSPGGDVFGRSAPLHASLAASENSVAASVFSPTVAASSTSSEPLLLLLDRKSGRWRSIAAPALPADTAAPVAAPRPFTQTGYTGATVRLSTSAGGTFSVVRDSRGQVTRHYAPPHSSLAASVRLRVAFLYLADKTAYVGTDRAGLLRYDLSSGKWLSPLLAGTEIVSGDVAEDGSLWLLSRSGPQSGPSRYPGTQGAAAGNWQLARVDIQSGKDDGIQKWSAPSSSPSSTSFGSYSMGVSYVEPMGAQRIVRARGGDGKIWIVEDSLSLQNGGMGGNGANARTGPPLHAFDPKSQKWGTGSPEQAGRLGKAPAVPDAVLVPPLPKSMAAGFQYGAAPRVPQTPVRFAAAQARRFPDWYWPEWKAPDVLLGNGNGNPNVISGGFPGGAGGNTLAGKPDKNGFVWRIGSGVDGSTALERVSAAGGKKSETFPLPANLILPGVPEVRAVAASGNTLYVATRGGLHALDLSTKTWRDVALSGLSQPASADNISRVIAREDGQVWLGGLSGGAVYQIDGPTGRVAQTYRDTTGSRPLLGVTPDGGAAFVSPLFRVPSGARGPVRIPMNRVDRIDTRTGQRASLPTPPVPAAGAQEPQPVGATGSIVWYVSRGSNGGEQGEVLGYDSDAAQWTPPLRITIRAGSVGLLRDETDGSVLVTSASADAHQPGGFGNGGGIIHRYEPQARAWSTVASSLPPPRRGENRSSFYPLIPAAAAPSALYFVEQQTMTLWRWDRAMRRWADFPAPEEVHLTSGDSQPDMAVRVGNALFIASPRGLWRFDLEKRLWSRALVPTRSADYRLTNIAEDERTVWAHITRMGQQQPLIARFDKQGRSWKIMGLETGIPEQQVEGRLIPDGDSCWLLWRGKAYRFDFAANRWRNLSPPLFGARTTTATAYRSGVRRIVPDGKGRFVYLLNGGSDQPGPGQHSSRDAAVQPTTPTPLIARYDIQTGKLAPFTAHGLPAPTEASARDAAVVGDTLYLATTRGVFVCNAAKGDWRPLRLPVPVPDGFQPHRIAYQDGALWIADADSVIRWRIR